MDPVHAQFTKRYNIPLDHLDFKYISNCSDVKELENIYRVLLSGQEGRYPELEGHCEARLNSLAPSSRVLRKDQPPLHPSSVAEWPSIEADLHSWANSSAAVDQQQQPQTDESLPPVRAANATISLTQKVAPKPAAAASAGRRPMPRSYDEWSRLEKQLEQQEVAEESSAAGTAAPKQQQQPPPPPPEAARAKKSLPSRLRVDGLSAEERLRLAEQEKAKGNEACRSSDFEEAALYYTRSVSASPLVAAYNNRAFAYLKLQKYTACVKDCSRVLKSEPSNAKALMRRATAYHRIHRSADARADLERLLQLEPSNSTAASLLAEVDALLAKRGKPAAGAKRMVIEEVGSSDEEEEVVMEEAAAGCVSNGRTMEASESPEPRQAAGTPSEPQGNPAVVDCPIATQAAQKGTDAPQKGAKDSAVVAQKSKPKKKSKKSKTEEGNEGSRGQLAGGGGGDQAEPAKDEFESAKDAGNRLFKAGNYSRAMELYNRCTELRPEDPVPFTNRAVCCVKLDRPNDAVYECNMALELEPNNMKAIFRRGVARKMLGFYRESLLDLNLAKSFDPLNKQIGREIADVEATMRRTAGRRVLVQEVDDEDDEGAEEVEDHEAGDSSVPVIRDVGGVVTEGFASATSTATIVNSPAADKAPSSGKETAPVADKAASSGKEAAPVADKAASSRKEAAPVADKAASSGKEAAPVADKSTSSGKEAAPVADKTASPVEPVADSAKFPEPVADSAKFPEPAADSAKFPEPAADSAKFPEPAADSAKFPEPAADKPILRHDCSPFEFTQAWLSAGKGARSGPARHAAHAGLLLGVAPERLPRLLSNKLDGPLLQQIVAAVRHCLLPQDARAGARILLSLPAAERFQFVAMFLDGRDKAELTATLAKLQELGAASTDEIHQLKAAYQL